MGFTDSQPGALILQAAQSIIQQNQRRRQIDAQVAAQKQQFELQQRNIELRERNAQIQEQFAQAQLGNLELRRAGQAQAQVQSAADLALTQARIEKIEAETANILAGGGDALSINQRIARQRAIIEKAENIRFKEIIEANPELAPTAAISIKELSARRKELSATAQKDTILAQPDTGLGTEEDVTAARARLNELQNIEAIMSDPNIIKMRDEINSGRIPEGTLNQATAAAGLGTLEMTDVQRVEVGKAILSDGAAAEASKAASETLFRNIPDNQLRTFAQAGLDGNFGEFAAVLRESLTGGEEERKRVGKIVIDKLTELGFNLEQRNTIVKGVLRELGILQ